MNTTQMVLTSPELFQGKSQLVQDLYQALRDQLNQLGPVQETMKAISVSFENRKRFASALIRDHSIKLILRTNHKITSPRIRNMEQVAAKSYDHTVLISSSRDIDTELMEWLGDAYHAGK
jgi:hypothetical protein